ncbi:MAG TPA: hypothetical protein VGJ15_13695 [Pirellulales bacterium]
MANFPCAKAGGDEMAAIEFPRGTAVSRPPPAAVILIGRGAGVTYWAYGIASCAQTE